MMNMLRMLNDVGPKGSYCKYEGHVFILAANAVTGLLFGVIIGLDVNIYLKVYRTH